MQVEQDWPNAGGDDQKEDDYEGEPEGPDSQVQDAPVQDAPVQRTKRAERVVRAMLRLLKAFYRTTVAKTLPLQGDALDTAAEALLSRIQCAPLNKPGASELEQAKAEALKAKLLQNLIDLLQLMLQYHAHLEKAADLVIQERARELYEDDKKELELELEVVKNQAAAIRKKRRNRFDRAPGAGRPPARRSWQSHLQLS